jgi:cardiolipin-specific phospholipase
MASESLNSSHEDVHGRHQRPVENSPERISRTPYAAQAAAGAAAARAFFPLGYREGFSQWVSYNQGAPIAAFPLMICFV